MNEIDSAVEQMQAFTIKAYELGLEFAPKLVLTFITLLIGLWLIAGVGKLMKVSMEKSKVEPTLIPFMTGLVSWVLKVL